MGQTTSGLSGEMTRPRALCATDKEAMYRLYCAYFANTPLAQFLCDLEEKERVVVLREAESRTIQGFSTLLQWRTSVDGQPLVALYSGDTIVDRAYWGEAELARIWGRHVALIAAEIRDAPVYWFLISSGYKTYRFLSVFFKEFYPNYQGPTPPDMQRILDTLGRERFPDEYDPATGIVRLRHAAPLRAGVAEITPRRLKDPHVAFFVRANPGHASGDQLACLARIDAANATPAGLRMIAEP